MQWFSDEDDEEEGDEEGAEEMKGFIVEEEEEDVIFCMMARGSFLEHDGVRGPFSREVNPPRPHRRVNLTRERYRGFLGTSQRGTHPVVWYPIP
ncbi:hypothetical protein TELCIR_22713, partial [Teladorsagia circumcincta]